MLNRRRRLEWRLGEILNDRVERDFEYIVPQLLRVLDVDMTWYRRGGHTGHAQPRGRRGRLTEEALTDKRRGRHASRFSHRTCPQHGGGAAASTRHTGNDGIDAEVAQFIR